MENLNYGNRAATEKIYLLFAILEQDFILAKICENLLLFIAGITQIKQKKTNLAFFAPILQVLDSFKKMFSLCLVQYAVSAVYTFISAHH
jgi:hypothetical protein